MTEETQALLPVTPELLPCPFCGGPAKVDDEESEDVGGYFASCTKCPVSAWGDIRSEAVTAWNTRISHSLPGDVGMRDNETHRIIKLSEERGDFVAGPDGCVIFWPDDLKQGGFNAWHLRLIADELDRRNRGWFDQMAAALTPSPCPGDGMREALANDNEWVCAGIPDQAIEAGIAAWRAADVAMLAREESEHPEDMADWDEGMIVAAIFKAVGRAISGPSALSGDAGEGE